MRRQLATITDDQCVGDRRPRRSPRPAGRTTTIKAATPPNKIMEEEEVMDCIDPALRALLLSLTSDQLQALADAQRHREERSRREEPRRRSRQLEHREQLRGRDQLGEGAESAYVEEERVNTASFTARATRAAVPRASRKSVTSDLFHRWLHNEHSNKKEIDERVKAERVKAERDKDKDESSAEQDEQGVSEALATSPLSTSSLLSSVYDIYSELDLAVLSRKVAQQTLSMLNASSVSLWLAHGPTEDRYLELKVVEVRERSEKSDTNNVGHKVAVDNASICGSVALKRRPLHLPNHGNNRDDKGHVFKKEESVSKSSEKEMVLATSLLCLPIVSNDEVVGVLEALLSDPQPIDHTLLQECESYLGFSGLALEKAQLFQLSLFEYRKNQLLLSLARSLFSQQRSLEQLLRTIISEAKQMLGCQTCTVYLLEAKDTALESDLFASFLPTSTESPTSSSTPNKSCGPGLGKQEVRFAQAWQVCEDTDVVFTTSIDLQADATRIARHVASTREVLNLTNVHSWLGQSSTHDHHRAREVRNMLSVPIFSGQSEVIGVAQLTNKLGSESEFEEHDIGLMEAFAIFCGIGLQNARTYESAIKLMAKQKVALDCLSYHASASDEDCQHLLQSLVPSSAELNLDSYLFDDSGLSDDDTYKVALRMFLDFGLVAQFRIPYHVLCRFVLSVKKNYRNVKYHNWRHALNVCQTMFTVLRTGKMDRFMEELEILGLLVACLCHDLDHRGTNNAFQTKMDSPLAILYSTSTMEHHHFDQCVMILSSEGNNIFQGLSTMEYRRVMRIVEDAILSTDLALYFSKKDLFLETANKGEIDWQGDKKDLLCGMLMTACDVSAISKPWEIQHSVAKRVADEFFDQGDLEKLRLNTRPIAMMDRERKDELPQMQVQFIDVVCSPLYSTLADSFPWIKPLLDGCTSNREKWADLAEKVDKWLKVEMGLTWIDHDTIDRPVEELKAEASTDFEIKVETLNQQHQHHTVTKKASLKLPHGFGRRLSARSPSHRSHQSDNLRLSNSNLSTSGSLSSENSIQSSNPDTLTTASSQTTTTTTMSSGMSSRRGEGSELEKQKSVKRRMAGVIHHLKK